MKLALLVAIFIGSANAACPSNFVASISIPGKCYYVEPSYHYFFDAVNYCRNLIHGADILAIANGFENSEVAALLSSRGLSFAWTGSVSYDNKSHWIATAAGNSNYSNCGSSTSSGNAAFMYSNGSWGYNGAYAGYYIICQIYPDDPTTFPPPQITCPVGWTPSISAYGKCYKYIADTDFYSAIRNCQTTEVGDSHAELVTLVSQLEMMELYRISMFGYSWVSMTNLEGDGAWHWVDTLHPTDYFGPYGPPSSGNCAYTTYFMLYGDSCTANYTTICQYFLYEPSTPSPPITPSTPTLSPTSSGLNCPQNGIASLTEPRTCYYILNGTEGFQSARNACQALNVGFDYNDLFVPRTNDEYQEFEGIVLKQISYPLVWLGLTSSNGSWAWISGRANNVTNLWCSGQPDNAQYPDHQCGFIFSTNRYNGHICWIAGDCTDKYAVICQSSNTL